MIKFEETMKQAIKYINNYIGLINKPMRKAITLFTNKKWQKAYDLFHTNNENSEANLLASFGKFYCAAQLESNNAENEAHIVLNYTDFEFWPYLKEHNFPRYARRFAYQFLGYIEKEKSNFDEALYYIDEALYINSPIDNLDNIPLLELKVEIYLAMKNEVSAFFTIQKIIHLDSNNVTFIDITKSKEFISYLEINDLEKLQKGKENETAIQALKRYELFLKLHFNADKSEIEIYKPFFYEKITETEILKTENRLQFKFPPSYRNFILQYGLFLLGKNNNSESCIFIDSQTLHYELDNQWNEGFKTMSAGHLLDAKNLITFSFGDESLQSVWYYCFDKRSLNTETGEMSVYNFNQDEWCFEALSICKGNGFDRHISNLIDEQIDWILD